MKYLDEMLAEYGKSDVYPFHMPGHKRVALPFENPYRMDITEIDGFDNLHHATGILKEAQERAAALYGAAHSFYLVGGSTCGILAAICAAVPKRSKILVARNSHKSVYNALYLWELTAEYLYPAATDCDILGHVTPKQVEEALKEKPDIAAVVITSPTYEGVISDIKGIAAIAHEHGIPVIVDEAHGAHLGFSHGFPENAVKQGADIVIMSLHKTLPSFTQTALLHLCSDRIPIEKLRKYLGIFQTSSPSYLFMAGMDACIRMLDQGREQFFFDYEKRLFHFYDSTADLKLLHVMRRADFKENEAFDLDPSKLVIFGRNKKITGTCLHDILLNRYHLQMEMTSAQYVLAMTSILDSEEGFIRLNRALHEIDAYFGEIMTIEKPNVIIKTDELYRSNPVAMPIFEAETSGVLEIPLAEACGRTAAGMVCLYPPGIPLIVPGETITAELIENIRKCQEMGLTVEGCADKISVVQRG